MKRLTIPVSRSDPDDKYVVERCGMHLRVSAPNYGCIRVHIHDAYAIAMSMLKLLDSNQPVPLPELKS